MNIVKKIVRKFGVDIVRYSASSDSSRNSGANASEKKNRLELISKQIALEALSSVGRVSHVPLFTYFERPNKSSIIMEEIENLWWNSHGKLIEKVWVLSESVNNQYRKDYVMKASSFFKAGNQKAKVLDLGCGSGWFGRMIADKELEYHGMDFSSTQIEIANREKANSKNKDYLNYYCLSDIKKINNLNEITGVVIHAFLHHLYWEDLNNLFKELFNVLPDGCRFFIVEPIYPDPVPQKDKPDPFLEISETFINKFREYRGKIKTELIKNGLYDTKTSDELTEIVNESIQNGFFFSPKEVPFRLNEFKSFLNQYLKIESVSHCGVLNIETAQFLDRINSKEVQENYCKLLFPIVNSADQVLLNNNYFEEHQDNYLFTAFECILKKDVNEKKM